jgi:periplasmic copper chaperone A
MIFARVLSVVLLLTSMPLLAADASASLQIRDTWIRDAPPTARMRSGYAVLVNNSAQEIEIVSASSVDFGLVEMHETRIEKEIAKMVALPALKIAAHKSHIFKPGGAHFMLMQPKRDMQRGDSATIVLTLKSGETVEANFVVGAPPKASK